MLVKEVTDIYRIINRRRCGILCICTLGVVFGFIKQIQENTVSTNLLEA